MRNLLICTFGSFTTIVGMTMLVPYLPVYIRQLGVSDDSAVVHWSAVCFGATFLASALCAPLWGVLGDRYGRKPMLVRAGVGMCVAIALTGLAQDVWQLFFLRLLTGVLGGFASGSMILVADQTPAHRRAQAIGFLTSGVMAGNLAGPILGGTIPELVGPRLMFALTGGLIGIAALAVIIGLRSPQRGSPQPEQEPVPSTPVHIEASLCSTSEAPHSGVRPPARIVSRAGGRAQLWLLIAVASLITFASMSVEPFITVFMGQLPDAQSPAGWAGVALSATAAGTMLSGPLLGRIADVRGTRAVLISSLVVAAAFAAAQFFAASAVMLVVLRFCLGLAVGGLAPAVTAAIRERASADRVGRLLGFTVSAQYAGQVAGPLFGAWVATGAGMREAFLASGAVLGIAAVIVSFALRGRRRNTSVR